MARRSPSDARLTPARAGPLLVPGAVLHEPQGEGRARLAAFLVDSEGLVHGLTTNLIYSGHEDSVLLNGLPIGRMADVVLPDTPASPISDCLGVIALAPGLLLSPGVLGSRSVQRVVSPFEVLGSTVQLVRDTGPVTLGEVVGAGRAVKFLLRGKAVQRTFVKAIAIAPSAGAEHSVGRGDAGGLLMTAESQVMGVLIGRAGDHYYAAPLDDFLNMHGLRLAERASLIKSTRTRRRTASPLHDDPAADDFHRRIPAASSPERCQRVAEEVADQLLRRRGRADADAEFLRLWRAFDVPPTLRQSDDQQDRRKAHNLRLARGYLLRSWRQGRLPHGPQEEEARSLAFRSDLGLSTGAWARPIALIGEICREFEDVRHTRQGGQEILQLIIGYSGYHEERILADLISRLCFDQTGQPIIGTARSPWLFGRRLSDTTRRQINQVQGGADVRLVNVDAGRPGPGERLAERPVFQHLGYSAYARTRWLARLLGPTTPAAVRAWIANALQGAVVRTPQTLPARCWLLAYGRPPNYSQTEFEMLFQYIWAKARPLGGVPDLPPPSTRAPDRVFEAFMTGHAGVLMNGSIHDVLIEDWLAQGDDIVTLLEPRDFDELRASREDRPFAANALLLSERIANHPPFEDLFTDLYRLCWQQLTTMLDQPAHKSGVLRYLGGLLSPEAGSDWQWSFAASEEGIIRLMTKEVRSLTEGDNTVVRLPQRNRRVQES